MTRRDYIGKVRSCTVEGCTKPHQAKGLCANHYQQQYKRNLKLNGGPKPMTRTKVWHQLTDVDRETMTATCSECGPGTMVYESGNYGRVKCRPAEIKRMRRYRLRREYGLTEAEADALDDRAAGCCELCGKETKLHVDHDHDTGVVRGMLCIGCNLGLGHLNDPELLRRAADWLENNGPRG